MSLRRSWRVLAAAVAVVLSGGCGPASEQKAAAPTTAAATAAPAAGAKSSAVAASGSESGAEDRYDGARMDYKPSAAVLSGERHTGAFAQGSALSMDATVKPLVSDAVKEIRLDTTHKVI